jgi:hypothetical protein
VKTSLLEPPEFYTGGKIKVPGSYGEAVRMTFTSSGPLTSFTLIAFSVGYRGYLGDWGWLDWLAVFVVIVCWTFIEWALHFYVLHAKPLPIINRRMKTIFSRMHGNHHKDPWNLDYVYFKGPSIFGLFILVTGVLWPVFGLGPALTFIASLLLMLERHQWVHLLVHSKVPVKSKYLLKIIDVHTKHHTIDSSKYMGVSAYLADEIIGTNP